MVAALIAAIVLVSVTVIVHAGGFALLLRLLMNARTALPTKSWPIVWLLVRITWCLILIHCVEVAIWALFYLWAGCMPDAEAAFYFSGVTYATVGYGDHVLPKPWRMLGAIEGLVGILMCGLSTGLFFAVVSRILATRIESMRK
jgi:hypothetical protein